jgi:hypothetical protein
MTTTPSNSSIGLSKLDRHVSVAPMLDWTDERQTVWGSGAYGGPSRLSPLRLLEFAVWGGAEPEIGVMPRIMTAARFRAAGFGRCRFVRHKTRPCARVDPTLPRQGETFGVFANRAEVIEGADGLTITEQDVRSSERPFCCTRGHFAILGAPHPTIIQLCSGDVRAGCRRDRVDDTREISASEQFDGAALGMPPSCGAASR